MLFSMFRLESSQAGVGVDEMSDTRIAVGSIRDGMADRRVAPVPRDIE